MQLYVRKPRLLKFQRIKTPLLPISTVCHSIHKHQSVQPLNDSVVNLYKQQESELLNKINAQLIVTDLDRSVLPMTLPLRPQVNKLKDPAVFESRALSVLT